MGHGVAGERMSLCLVENISIVSRLQGWLKKQTSLVLVDHRIKNFPAASDSQTSRMIEIAGRNIYSQSLTILKLLPDIKKKMKYIF